MGEAKIKRRAHAAMLERHPFCIYCGGKDEITVEHMPPIQMFRLRQRPNGLVFPACRECNNGTSHSDLVAALMGRMYPDAEAEGAKKEIKKLMEAVGNNVPGLLEEMMVDEADEMQLRLKVPHMPVGGRLLRANGPIMTQHMLTFGAKLGFALHFEAHGTPVPVNGGVQPMYFTNVSAARGELPMGIIEMLPAPITLRQGVREVGRQFSYSWRVTEEERHSIFYAVFNDAFSIAAVTAFDRFEFLAKHAQEHPIWTPGSFVLPS
jgi:hypothetical protein